MTPTERLSTGSKRYTSPTITLYLIPSRAEVRGRLLRNASEGTLKPRTVLLPFPNLILFHSMLCDVQDRLGSQGGPGGSIEIKAHPFFHGVDWNGLRSIRAPFEPRLSSAIDVSYFPIDDINQDEEVLPARGLGEDEQSVDMELPFVGYTFKRFKGMNEA